MNCDKSLETRVPSRELSNDARSPAVLGGRLSNSETNMSCVSHVVSNVGANGQYVSRSAEASAPTASDLAKIRDMKISQRDCKRVGTFSRELAIKPDALDDRNPTRLDVHYLVRNLRPPHSFPRPFF